MLSRQSCSTEASPSRRWGKQESMELVSLLKVTMLESGRAVVCRVYLYWVTVSHKTRVTPHRHRCTFCVLPYSGGFCTEGSLTASTAVRGTGLGGEGAQRERRKPRFSTEIRKKKLLEASRFKTRPVLSHEQKLIYSNLAPDTWNWKGNKVPE